MQNFTELFSNYSNEAFRLELLPQYKVPGEWENFLTYKNSHTLRSNSELEEYIQEAKAKVLGGARHIRARVIPMPMSDYLRFETQIGYIPQSFNGFEHNFLEEDEYKTILRQLNIESESVSDFWMFDCKTVVIMKYDLDGNYIGHQISQDVLLLEKCISIRNAFIKSSHPLSYVIDKIANLN